MTDTRTLREHAVAALAAYDRANPMRTADWHGDDCDCFRCEMDRLRTILASPTAPAQPEQADAVGEARILTDPPAEGTWAVLYPGYYGPFTACRADGAWRLCEDADLKMATHWTPLDIPALARKDRP